MGRNFTIGAKLPKGQEVDCDWSTCDTPVHDHRISYNKGGVIKRGTYTGSWLHPSSLYPQKASLLYWYNKGGHMKVIDKLYNYRIRRHHVIPVNVMKILEDIPHNLDLLTWNMNNGDNNGLCLPFDHADMAWHDLQVHRGSHPKYDQKILKSLNELRVKCEKLCETDDQDDLLERVRGKVTLFKKKLVNWRIILHTNTLTMKKLKC